MPDDKYNGLYIHKELVKGNWYGICSGPKPQVYTGNIDTASNLEDIRNKALYIVSPSSENGTFPVYGHKSAVLTTRYGSDVYLQRLFDIDAGVEWERAKIGSTSWYAWKRVTTEGDASATASAADQRSRNNATAINQIDSAIGGRTASPNINSRVSSNTSSINSMRTELNKVTVTANNAANNAVKALGYSGKLKNLADNKIINVYQGNAVIDIPGSSNASPFPYWNNPTANAQWARDHGCNAYNSIMLIDNTNADGQLGHEIHLEGTQFRGDLGWILTYDRSTLTSRTDGVYGLLCTWILFVIGGNWN